MNGAVETVWNETRRAIGVLAAQSHNADDKAWTEGSISRFEAAAHHYRRSMMQVARGTDRLSLKKQRQGEDLLLNSFNSRLCAVLRSMERFELYAHPAEIVDMARRLTVWKPLSEHILAYWVPKGPGSYRLICQDGFWRTAQRLLVRDMYSLLGIEAGFDFSKKGGGGEKGLINHVCKHVASGVDWWVSTDIKNCFPSLRPTHFEWLPMDRRLLKNIVFVPKCVNVKVVIPKDHKALLKYLQETYHDHAVNSMDDMVSFTVQMVRQGLAQGSVLSPLLARGFVGRELQAALGDLKVVPASSADDVYIGARTYKVADAALQAFKTKLKEHPAGPIELHDGKPEKASANKVIVLGYRLVPGQGHGDNPVHVKPARKRISRFKNRLNQRLLNAALDKDLMAIGLKYWANWYAGQQAWTKVPDWSERTSQSYAIGYVIDFEHNIPMGGNYIKGFDNKTAFYS